MAVHFAGRYKFVLHMSHCSYSTRVYSLVLILDYSDDLCLYIHCHKVYIIRSIRGSSFLLAIPYLSIVFAFSLPRSSGVGMHSSRVGHRLPVLCWAPLHALTDDPFPLGR